MMNNEPIVFTPTKLHAVAKSFARVTPGSSSDMDYNQWLAANVKNEGNVLPTLSPSHGTGLAAYLTRIDHALTRIEASQQRQEGILMKLLEALEEDQEPEEMPSTYLSGKSI